MPDLLTALGAAIERARETRRPNLTDPHWHCDSCTNGFWGAPPDACWHGVTACDECPCADCGVEARRP